MAHHNGTQEAKVFYNGIPLNVHVEIGDIHVEEQEPEPVENMVFPFKISIAYKIKSWEIVTEQPQHRPLFMSFRHYWRTKARTTRPYPHGLQASICHAHRPGAYRFPGIYCQRRPSR